MAKLTVPIIVKWDDIEEDLAKGNIVKVIRCKDCKYWRANTQFCSVFSSLNIAHRMPPDGYCSEAERKEE